MKEMNYFVGELSLILAESFCQ